jgi:glycosyltransferase involved in cell wall biosynthesis
MQKNPRGGTELQLEYLRKYVDSKLLDQVQITTSVPEKIPLSKNKINILWQKNSYDQPNLAPWFQDKSNHSKYDWYVFNSHWNYEKFRYFFDIPTEKSVVIKNGIDNIKPSSLDYKKGNPIKLIFTPTPWRGLNVMLAAMQLINNPLITLDVYSSTEVYGKHFKEANDKQYQELYDQAKELPNVNYIGYKPNEYIKEHLKDYHMFVYPNIWEETFCISALEAMAAGLYTIVTNNGALFETCSEFAIYMPFEKDFMRLAKKTAVAIEAATQGLHMDLIKKHLKFQIDYVNRFYNWDKQGQAWTRFLQGAINERRK